MTRRWGVAALLTVLAVAGCGESKAAGNARIAASDVPSAPATTMATAVPTSTATTTSPAPAKRPTNKKAVTVAPAASGIDRFLAAVQAKLPDVAMDRRDDELTDLGDAACDAQRAGKPPIPAVQEQGVSAADARVIVTLAQGTICGK